MDELADRTRTAIADVRRLVYALRPPALDELGQVAAIRQSADVDGSGIEIRIDAPESLPPLSAAVEVAAYRIAQEAVANVVRHSGARSCRLSMTFEGGVLRLEVSDDGAGSQRMNPPESACARCANVPRSWAGALRSRPWPAAEPASPRSCPVQWRPDGRPAPVLIVDDHPLFRDGMRGMLESIPEVTVAGEAENGREAVQLATELRPDIVLMDIGLPGMNGIEATRALLAACPTARVLVLTMYEEPDSVFSALRAGARGYLLKDARPDEIVRATRAVAEGEAIFGPAIAERLATFFRGGGTPRPPAAFPELTSRETETLDVIARGMTNQEMAAHFGVSLKTIQNHVSNVLAKLHVVDRTQAALRAREAGLG